MMKMHPFVEAVASLQFENCFNPYSDRCEIHDRVDAPMRRALSLSSILYSAIQKPIDAIWIGRDLGYRGGRRTGLALTDDVHITKHTKRWNMSAHSDRPTIGNAMAERTAAVIWNMLDHIDSRIFLWNVFPLHPHEPNDPFTNRQHNAQERRAGESLLIDLIELLQPARIVAIGNDAAVAANRLNQKIPVIQTRHPSYGGQGIFQEQIITLYGNCTRGESFMLPFDA